MKKFFVVITIFLVVIFGVIYFTYGKEILTLLDEKKVYNVEGKQTISLDTLDEYQFFNNGILTYNNQKIVLLGFENDIKWVSEDTEFSKQVFVTDEYIFRNMENKIQVIDKNSQKFIITEIEGYIANVSRENGKIYIIMKNSVGENSLYIMNEGNELIVDNKIFDDNITGVSISDKSEGYALITLRLDNKTTVNTLYFNLLDDVELWNTTIDDEILIKTKVVNNNIIAIGTKNLYYFNTNGKLMWKNGIYNKILDYDIVKDDQRIYILYEKDDSAELISYNFEGKVMNLRKAPKSAQKLKVDDSKIFVYNDTSIYMMHGIKTDKIYEDTEGMFSDFTVDGNNIRILSKDKVITGKIK